MVVNKPKAHNVWAHQGEFALTIIDRGIKGLCSVTREQVVGVGRAVWRKPDIWKRPQRP